MSILAAAPKVELLSLYHSVLTPDDVSMPHRQYSEQLRGEGLHGALGAAGVRCQRHSDLSIRSAAFFLRILAIDIFSSLTFVAAAFNSMMKTIDMLLAPKQIAGGPSLLAHAPPAEGQALTPKRAGLIVGVVSLRLACSFCSIDVASLAFDRCCSRC